MARRNDDVECETETWLIRNHIEQNESYFHIFVYFADNMKRENEDNYEEPQQQIMDNIIAQDQGTDNDESQDAINDTNNFNQNNQDNGGGPNPPKRQRRNDDEEIRLLIPSKVNTTLSKFKTSIQLLPVGYEKQQIDTNLIKICYFKMAGAVIGKGGQNIQKLRTEVCFSKIFNAYIILSNFIIICLRINEQNTNSFRFSVTCQTPSSWNHSKPFKVEKKWEISKICLF